MYSKPRLKFVSFIFLFIVYYAIVLAVLCIVHILYYVKQYDVTRSFFINEQFAIKITQRKFIVHVIFEYWFMYKS